MSLKKSLVIFKGGGKMPSLADEPPTKTKESMTITINTSVQNFDPSGTCNDAELRDSIAAFGTAAVAAMEGAFPGSEVNHNVIEGDVSRSIEISYDETQNHDDALFEAQRVIEAVYETGTFWA